MTWLSLVRSILEALLDILEKDNRGNLREVTMRCDEFHTEVSRWQVLQEVYLEPLVKSASASAGAAQEPEPVWHLAMQGLPAAIQVLRQLGKRVSPFSCSAFHAPLSCPLV